MIWGGGVVLLTRVVGNAWRGTPSARPTPAVPQQRARRVASYLVPLCAPAWRGGAGLKGESGGSGDTFADVITPRVARITWITARI